MTKQARTSGYDAVSCIILVFVGNEAAPFPGIWEWKMGQIPRRLGMKTLVCTGNWNNLKDACCILWASSQYNMLLKLHLIHLTLHVVLFSTLNQKPGLKRTPLASPLLECASQGIYNVLVSTSRTYFYIAYLPSRHGRLVV